MNRFARALLGLGGACCLVTAAAAHDVEVRDFNLPSQAYDENDVPLTEPALADVIYWTDSANAPSGQLTTSLPARSRAFGRFENGYRASEDSEPVDGYRLRRTGLVGGFGVVSGRVRETTHVRYERRTSFRTRDCRC